MTYYRYEDIRCSVGDEEYGFSTHIFVELREFEVIKQTPRGVWLRLSPMFDDKRFVLLGTRKQFAHPSKELARESFIARKRKQMKIYEKRIKDIKTALVFVGAK